MSQEERASAPPVRRALCLGNELMADDAFGPIVAAEFEGGVTDSVVHTSAAGFGLMDHVLDVTDLLVIDTIKTGTAKPGTVFVLDESDLRASRGPSSHFVGLLEMLLIGRKLRLPFPQRVLIVAVEARDISTIGAGLHPEVRAAVPVVVNMVRGFLNGSPPTPTHPRVTSQAVSELRDNLVSGGDRFY